MYHDAIMMPLWAPCIFFSKGGGSGS